MHIVLTNDDGIYRYESRLLPLAEALAAFARVTVVVPSRDRSGCTHYNSLGEHQRTLESRRVYLAEATDERRRIEIHSVEGFPADCVALALRGMFREEAPDLLISGLNGGPNLGASWIASGTVGAARMAAHMGVPAIAVSGVNYELEGSVEAIAHWLARLARSPRVLEQQPGHFLTVGIPRRPAAEIQGIRVARRSPRLGVFYLEQGPPFHTLALTRSYRKSSGRQGSGDGAGASERSVWLLQPPKIIDEPPPGSDVDLYRQGFIVVTPMVANEDVHGLIDDAESWVGELPDWSI